MSVNPFPLFRNYVEDRKIDWRSARNGCLPGQYSESLLSDFNDCFLNNLSAVLGALFWILPSSTMRSMARRGTEATQNRSQRLNQSRLCQSAISFFAGLSETAIAKNCPWSVDHHERGLHCRLEENRGRSRFRRPRVCRCVVLHWRRRRLAGLANRHLGALEHLDLFKVINEEARFIWKHSMTPRSTIIEWLRLTRLYIPLSLEQARLFNSLTRTVFLIRDCPMT